MNRFFGNNRYNFGLFGANCGGGMTMSAAPERWMARWDDIDRLYRMADAAGVEFILPIAKWRGLGGDADTPAQLGWNTYLLSQPSPVDRTEAAYDIHAA